MLRTETRTVRRGDRVLLWEIVKRGDRQVRRRLIDLTTGELLDEVWQDEFGRTLSRTDPPVPGVPRVRESTHISSEHGRSQGHNLKPGNQSGPHRDAGQPDENRAGEVRVCTSANGFRGLLRRLPLRASIPRMGDAEQVWTSRRESREVSCPECGAGAGEPCIRPDTIPSHGARHRLAVANGAVVKTRLTGERKQEVQPQV